MQYVGRRRLVTGFIKWLRELARKKSRGGMHLWAFLRGTCVVRGQQLGMWFGQLGPIDGTEEGDDGARVFRRGFGRFFRRELK